MSCNIFYANGCTCNNCPNLVKSTSIAVNGDILEVTIPQMQLTNGSKLCVILCQAIPDTITAAMSVQVVSGTTKLYVFNKCGNLIYADQLFTRRVLHMSIATDTSVGMVNPWTKLGCTRHTFPVLNAPAAPATPAAAIDEDSNE